MNGYRTCKICLEHKPKDRFQPQGYQCRECRTEKQRAHYASLPPKTAEQRKKAVEAQKRWTERNLERVRQNRKAQHLKRTFNLTLEQYEQMALAQNQVCAICENACETGYALAVDHCHKTNQIRALLCKNCNTALGLFKDNTDIMERAIEYVKKYSMQEAVN